MKLGADELKEDTLCAGDFIEYFSPLFVAGDARGHRIAKVLQILDDDSDYPLRLDSQELLATTVMIRKRKARDEEDDDCDTKDAIWRKIRTLKLVKGEVKGLRRSDLLNGNMKNVFKDAMESTREILKQSKLSFSGVKRPRRPTSLEDFMDSQSSTPTSLPPSSSTNDADVFPKLKVHDTCSIVSFFSLQKKEKKLKSHHPSDVSSKVLKSPPIIKSSRTLHEKTKTRSITPVECKKNQNPLPKKHKDHATKPSKGLKEDTFFQENKQLNRSSPSKFECPSLSESPNNFLTQNSLIKDLNKKKMGDPDSPKQQTREDNIIEDFESSTKKILLDFSLTEPNRSRIGHILNNSSNKINGLSFKGAKVSGKPNLSLVYGKEAKKEKKKAQPVTIASTAATRRGYGSSSLMNAWVNTREHKS